MVFKIFLIRIISCFALSILVGLERQYRHRMVGLRTNVLVSLGAFMFVMVSFGVHTGDESRIAAQVVSGIGFLGAGVILRDGSKIKGLNTAATLWCVAAIGVLTASGMIMEALVGTLLVLISNILLRFISIKIMEGIKKRQIDICTIKITILKKDEMNVRKEIGKYFRINNLNLDLLERNEITKEEIKLKVIVKTNSITLIEELINKLSVEDGVNSISWDHVNFSKVDLEDEEEETSD